MAISNLPLGYCANVHPGRNVGELISALAQYAVPVSRRLARPMAIGLWFPRSVASELSASQSAFDRLRRFLEESNLCCYTLNAFPFGDFHAERVKEQVYLPDWADSARCRYTLDCADLLARLLPPDCEGSVSTAPLAFKRLLGTSSDLTFHIRGVIDAALGLARIHERTGRLIRLAIEPEPLCALETTRETVEFFSVLVSSAADQAEEDAVRRHLGICYDVCHQAVEFEDIGESMERIAAAGIRIAKMHLTNALELPDPTDKSARVHLSKFVEPRYLHQTFCLLRSGETIAIEDLTHPHALSPPDEWLEATSWRVHFHVPVDREWMGPLKTTRAALVSAIEKAARLDYAPHLEIETYTWDVLRSAGEHRVDLVDGLCAELNAATEFMNVAKVRL